MPYKYGWSKTVRKSRNVPTVDVSRPCNWKQYNASGVLQITSGGPTPVRVNQGISEIVYTTRPKGSSLIKSNWCVHTNNRTHYTGDPTSPQITMILVPGFPGWYYQYWGAHSFGEIDHQLAITVGKAALGSTLGPAFLMNNAQAYINDAASRIQYTDLTNVSIPNFLADIDDVRTLFQAWKKSVSLAKNVAGGYLNYKFGWKPTIGDLTDAVLGVRELQRKLKQFKALYGQVIHERKVLLNSTTEKSGIVDVASDNRYVWKATLKQKVESFIYYSPQHIAALNDFDEKIRGIIDTLGFELNPRIIWDALPFTFVIDWFFNVGKQLERFKIDALELPILYTDSFLQYKQELKIESYLISDKNNNVSSTTFWPSWITTEDCFVRFPILPDASVLTDLGFRAPTKNQWTLLAALGTVLSKHT